MRDEKEKEHLVIDIKMVTDGSYNMMTRRSAGQSDDSSIIVCYAVALQLVKYIYMNFKHIYTIGISSLGLHPTFNVKRLVL